MRRLSFIARQAAHSATMLIVTAPTVLDTQLHVTS